MLKILLVRAPVISNILPPIGLAYIAAAAKQKGYDVKTDDLNIKFCNTFNVSNESLGDIDSRQKQKAFFDGNEKFFNSWVENVVNSKVDVVGFSVWVSNIYITEQLAERIKQKNSKIKIVCGGPSVDGASFVSCLERNIIDAVVYNEGEETFLEILKNIESTSGFKISGEGVGFISNGVFVKTPPRAEIKNINALPFIDLADIPLESYSHKAIPIMFSRGCSWNCKFCTKSQGLRPRTADNIFNEILLRMRQYKREKYNFYLYDCALNQDVEMLSGLCDKIIDNLPAGAITFTGFAKVMKGMDIDFMKQMRKAGFAEWSLGVESGSDKVLKLMGKPCSALQAEEFIKNSCEAGIRQVVNLIVGFPGETEADWDDTINFIERVSPYADCIHLSYLWLLPDMVKQRFAGSVILESDNCFLWKSADGSNTYEARQKRVARLDERVSKLTTIKKTGTMVYSKVKPIL